MFAIVNCFLYVVCVFCSVVGLGLSQASLFMMTIDYLRPNSITLASSLAGRRPASEPARELDSVMEFQIWKIPLHYLARDLARKLARELVCYLLWLNSITLSRSQTWSQTWFPTCRRQVRAILTSRDSSNLVADRLRPYSITLSCSLAGLRPARQVCDQLVSWSQTCSRASRKLDSVMEFGLRHAYDVHTQSSSPAAREPARELVASMEFGRELVCDCDL